MNWEMITTIILSISTIVGIFTGYYFYIKYLVEKAIAQEVDTAEKSDKVKEEKLELVTEKIFALVPIALKAFVTKNHIKNAVQKAFDSIESYAKQQVAKKK